MRYKTIHFFQIAVLGLAAAIGIGGAVPSACAQERTQDPFQQQRDREGRYEQLQRSLSSRDVTVPLEGALDPTRYVVGPGDVFSIFVGGAQPINLSQPVSAEGSLVLPEVGSVPVDGSTLREARRRALSALRNHFQNVSLEVTLVRPREFYVHVSGAVPVAGRYLATPVARVSNVIEVAFADTTQAAVDNPLFAPSFRTIKLIRKNGTERTVDLQRYFATGNTEYNPYLRDGDVISVPAYDPSVQSVRVDGAVPFPGRYAYRADDTVLDLLALATGQQSLDDIERVRLTRHRERAPSDTMMLNVSAMVAGEQEPVQLRPLDHVFVVAGRERGGTATVEGWVRYPGTYPVEPGRTTVRDLVERAGGMRGEALAHGAYLVRDAAARASRSQRQMARQLVQMEEPPATHYPERVRPDTSLRFLNTRLSELDFLSRSYFVREFRQGWTPIDLSVAPSENSPVYVRDGDRLVVPRDRQSVLVVGQVNQPGYVNYRPTRGVQEYLAAAGGTTDMSGKAYVIKAGTRQYLPADETQIQSGDVIFTDRQQDIASTAEMQRVAMQERESRRNYRFRIIQTTLSVLSTLATIAIVALRN